MRKAREQHGMAAQELVAPESSQSVSYVTKASLRWIARLLADRLRIPLELHLEAKSLYLRLPGADGRIEFPCLAQVFSRRDSGFPCVHWNAKAEGWSPPVADVLPAPGAERLPAQLITSAGNVWRFDYDVPGLIYWQLARIEEIGCRNLDSHGRFPSSMSHARRHGYLHRPIVDEWISILSQVASRQWPSINIPRSPQTTIVSHDVDHPARFAFCSPGEWTRRFAGALVCARWREAFGAMRTPMGIGASIPDSDPYNTYQWLMDQSEARGLRSTFYFMAGCTDPRFDSGYDPFNPTIRSIIRSVAKRGHCIGIHPSYGTYEDPSELIRESERLREIVVAEMGAEMQMGGRAHYLRWSQSRTPRRFALAGLVHDASLGYPDRPGFRSGTSYSYPAFDSIADEELPIVMQPLIAMEGAAFACAAPDDERSPLKALAQLKENCRRVGGAFSLLWHNSELATAHRKAMYVAALDC